MSAGDLFLPPEPTLTPSDVGYTGRMSIGDTASITTPSAGKHGLVTFSGERGQRVALQVNTNGHAYSTMTLYGPNGLPVGPTTGASIYSKGMLDPQNLPDTGTYTLHLWPSGATGPASLSIYEADADTLGEIEASGPQVTVTTSSPGQNHRLTFEGAAGQKISLRTSNLTYASGYGAYVSIRGPTGVDLQAPAFATSPDGGFLDTLTLPDNGIYTILVDPYLWSTGQAKLRLYNVPGDATVPATLGGSAVTVTTTAPGQNGVVTFSATAGQRIAAKITGATFVDGYAWLRDPSGSNIAGPAYASSGSPGFLEAVAPTTGTYSVLLDPHYDTIGSATVTLFAPSDATGTIPANGTETTATIGTPGQNAALTFSGTAGQRVSLTSSSSLSGDVYSYGGGSIELRDPSGAAITSSTLVSPYPSDFFDAVALPSSGTYTLYVNPASDRTGTVAIRLYDAADATTSGTLGGSAASVATTIPGQNAAITFSGTAGDRVAISSSGLAYSNSYVAIKAPSGATVLAPTYANQTPVFFEPVTLTETGTHTISIDPYASWTGTVSMTLHAVPADDTDTLANPGSQSLTITTPGQNGTLTFSGTTGEDLRLQTTALSISESYLRVKKPDGSDLLTQKYLYSSSQGWDLPTLPTTGTYTVVLDPLAAFTGGATFELSEQDLGGQSIQGLAPPASGAATAKTPNEPAPKHSPEANTATAGEQRPAALGATAKKSAKPKAVKKSVKKKLKKRVRILTPGVGRSQVVGRVRTVKGAYLKNVTVSIGRSRARTNAKGVFRLTRVVPGQRTLIIDGTRIRKGRARYGVFEAALTVQPTNRTDVPFTVWMPKLDTARAVTLPKVLKKPFAVRTKAIPGLSLVIPKGAKVVDRHGKQVRKLTITRIPIKRTPHPLPAGVRVPVYYSIQPALSRVVGANGKPARARIIYPNYTYQRRGTKMNFWHYAASDGWQILGTGRVTKNRLVVPDKGVGMSRLSGAMIGNSNNAPVNGTTPGGEKDGDPVDLSTGRFGYHQSDLVLPDVLPISLTRVYNSGDGRQRSFGYQASNAYDLFLSNDTPYQSASLYLPEGGRIRFERISPGTSQQGAVYEHTGTPGPFFKARLSYRPGNGGWYTDGWDLRMRDGTTLSFASDSLRAVLIGIRDRFGNEVTIVRETPSSVYALGRIKIIRSPNGRWIKPTYDGNDRIISAKDNLGRQVSYTYDGASGLDEVTNTGGGTTSYGYDAYSRVDEITDARGITFLTNVYDGNGRVTSQTQADSTTYGFDYDLDGSGNVTATEVTNPRAVVRRIEFSAKGYPTSDTDAYGTGEARTTTYTRSGTGDLVTRVTDPAGRNTDFTYTASGDVSSVTRLAGTGDAVTTEMTYEPIYGLLASVTDPLEHTTAYGYGSSGALTSITDPRNKTTEIANDEDGQPTSIEDPLGHETTIVYSRGAVSTATDDLGNASRSFTDAVGRPVSGTDATGRTARRAFDALNRVTSVTNAAGEQIAFGHDANGNVTTVTDARSKVTEYTFNSMDRVTEREDPLGNSDTFTYDANGNLATSTDREGQVTRFAYDAHDRQTSVGFDETPGSPPTYESTIDYAYDSAGRLVEADDSANGTIELDYDGLDRLTSEDTPTGTVSYEYDDADRRVSMQTAGQDETTYDYDAADRLTGITRGDQSPSFSYDDADRLTAVDLPGGVSMAYAYDDADRLTQIAYANGLGALGSIDYGYDSAGGRHEGSGSWARLELPAALASGTYDDANRLTGRGLASYTYDDNGNLTSDGGQSYAWNARGELSGLSGGSPSASFAYDAFGRRREATIGGTTTSFRYDADNAIVETTGGSSVRILAGLGTDSALTRTVSSDTEALLTDALGSTVALADDNGLVTTEYTYDPFGTPTATGAASENRTQFTGREWDGTGLQYSRARYYSPGMSRFISEDPIGTAGGDANLYAYVWNAPGQFTDPSGLCGVLDLGGCAKDAGSWWMNSGSVAVMDVMVDRVHPIAYALVPPYAAGYGLGARKDPWEVAENAAATAVIPLGGPLLGRGAAAAAAWWAKSRARDIATKALTHERWLGPIRVAPFGNRGPGRFHRPHYHRRKYDVEGNVRPGQGLGRHRPWDKSNEDKGFWDRF